MNTTTRIPIVLMSVEETAQAVSISVKTVRSLIRQGRLRAVNFGTRMTRIYLQDLLEIAKGQGYQVVLPSSLSLEGATSKKAQRLKDAETGSVNKLAKCRKTPRAGERAPDGVTHDTHYTMAEVLSTFNIKYGRFYEVRNRYQLQSVHAWGTTCFKKEDVERVIGLYNEEQGKNISDDWYTLLRHHETLRIRQDTGTQICGDPWSENPKVQRRKSQLLSESRLGGCTQEGREKQYYDQGKTEVRHKSRDGSNKLIYDPCRCNCYAAPIHVGRNKPTTQSNGYKTKNASNTCF